MIKPNELRKGNLIHYTGKPYPFYQIKDGIVEVEEILQDGVNRSQGDSTLYNIELLEGIPLTPEWLRKFGFITLDAETDIEVWGLNDNSNGEEFSIISDGIDAPMPLYFAYDLGYREVKKEIKYVHQLQNLHFILTG